MTLKIVNDLILKLRSSKIIQD